MKRIERFWTTRREIKLGKEEQEILTKFHEWIPDLVKEVLEKSIKAKPDNELLESDFLIGEPTCYHARMLLRTVLDKGFIRYARQSGKVYEHTDMMPDKAAIQNFLERNLLEGEEEAHFRYGAFPYFCAIATANAERNLSWVLLGKPKLNMLSLMAIRRFYDSWSPSLTLSFAKLSGK